MIFSSCLTTSMALFRVEKKHLTLCKIKITIMQTSYQMESYAPPSVTMRSVINPAQTPTKMPTIKTLFVVCFLPA